MFPVLTRSTQLTPLDCVLTLPLPHPRQPPQVTTVDKYQGQQNDYVLLSLVRTRAFGHLRDVRRLVVAMSRARLGLYVFGRAQLFGNCYELQPTFRCGEGAGWGHACEQCGVQQGLAIFLLFSFYAFSWRPCSSQLISLGEQLLMAGMGGAIPSPVMCPH